jgi:hypothetical protein
MSSSSLRAKNAASPRPEEAMSGPSQQPSNAERSAEAAKLAADLEHALAEGRLDAITPEALQAVIAAVCRIYSAHVEAGHQFLPLPNQNRVMDTDVMVMASSLLRAVNLQVFELGMWQSWTGR